MSIVVQKPKRDEHSQQEYAQEVIQTLQKLQKWGEYRNTKPPTTPNTVHTAGFSQPPCHRTTNSVGGRPEDVQIDDTNDYPNDDSKEPEQILRQWIPETKYRRQKIRIKK